MHVHLADARRWVAGDTGRYDLVQLDVYQGSPYIPFYLVTAEFFRLLRIRMADDGLLMMNLFDLSSTLAKNWGVIGCVGCVTWDRSRRYHERFPA